MAIEPGANVAFGGEQLFEAILDDPDVFSGKLHALTGGHEFGGQPSGVAIQRLDLATDLADALFGKPHLPGQGLQIVTGSARRGFELGMGQGIKIDVWCRLVLAERRRARQRQGRQENEGTQQSKSASNHGLNSNRESRLVPAVIGVAG